MLKLWRSQIARGQHTHPNPNGAALSALMKDLLQKQDSKKKQSFEDRGRGTIADGYDTQGLQSIVAEFWKLSQAGSVVMAATLRGRLDFILSHLLLARGEAHRFAELPDLQLLMLDNESPSPCPALLYIMSSGKTNQNGRIEYTGLLRNKDVSVCGMNALAFYFFWRWERSTESFPYFEKIRIGTTPKCLLVSLYSSCAFFIIEHTLNYFLFSCCQ